MYQPGQKLAFAPAEEKWKSDTIQRKLLLEPKEMAPIFPNDKEYRICMGIPMERTISQKAFFGFLEIAIQGWPFAKLEYTRNDIARHRFAQFLLESDYTHLIMLDSDHVHPPGVVNRLARWFRAYPDAVEVAGGLNFRRGVPYDPCAFIDPGDGKFRRMFEWQPGAIEVEALGTGSIMIARSVFEKIPQPWFGYEYGENLEDWPGTDMWFSKRCREAGITLWCDTTTTSPHIADTLIDVNAYRSWIAKSGGPVAPEQAMAAAKKVQQCV